MISFFRARWRVLVAALICLGFLVARSQATLLVGSNATPATSSVGNGQVWYYTAGYVASATGTADTAFVYAYDWAGLSTSRIKVVVFNSGGTILGISNPITVPPTTVAWASASFPSGFTITSGDTYRLGLVANAGTVDAGWGAGSFLASNATGAPTYADPSTAVASDAGDINRGAAAVYLDGTVGGGSRTPSMTLLGVGQ